SELEVAILGRPGGRPPTIAQGQYSLAEIVAILGRPGGRPPTPPTHASTAHQQVAILGRPGGRPPNRPRPTLSRRNSWLRSSAAPEGDRQHGQGVPVVEVVVVAILGRPGGRPPTPLAHAAATREVGCDPRPPRRATAKCRRGSRHRSSSGCDPRPPRRPTGKRHPGPTTRRGHVCAPR